MKKLVKLKIGELQKLSRAEMKTIMAGSGSCPILCTSGGCDSPNCKCPPNGNNTCLRNI